VARVLNDKGDDLFCYLLRVDVKGTVEISNTSNVKYDRTCWATETFCNEIAQNSELALKVAFPVLD